MVRRTLPRHRRLQRRGGTTRWRSLKSRRKREFVDMALARIVVPVNVTVIVKTAVFVPVVAADVVDTRR